MICPQPLGLCGLPAKLTAQDDGRGGRSPPFKMMLFHFILTSLFLVVILGKHPKLGVDLSLSVLGLYHLKLEQGKTITNKCVEVDLLYSETSCF